MNVEHHGECRRSEGGGKGPVRCRQVGDHREYEAKKKQVSAQVHSAASVVSSPNGCSSLNLDRTMVMIEQSSTCQLHAPSHMPFHVG